MNTTTIGTATEARPAKDTLSRAPGLSQTAERRARTLAPTVYCPATHVEECLERSHAGRLS